jgi:DoxX-like family
MQIIHQNGRLSWPAFIVLAVIAIALGAFSLFVGYNKAMAPLAVLREHSAWTIHLPVLLGRTVGWLEIVAAAVLILGLFLRPLVRWGSWAAVWITLNHAAAAVVHVIHAEWHTLTQSGVVIALCLAMVWLYRLRARSEN